MNRIEQLIQFLAESPHDSFLIHALALEYIKAGDDENGRACFEKNLLQSPDYVATYYHLGKLLERKGSVAEAISIYEKGMAIAQAAGDRHAFGELRSVYEELTF
jgi:Tfp pilus assembly protein PilF